LRIVLDCTAKHKEQSLLDMLYQGPDTTANLVGILPRFRKESVDVTADIEEMFMQVKVPKHGKGALRFLWWPQGDPLKDPEEYQITVQPFGATSSPICAKFALNRAAREFGTGYERAVLKAIEENFYVDDCLASFPTRDEALRFAKKITELLEKGDIVLLASETPTHGKWPMGTIDAVETDGDGLMQTVAVHTDGGKIRRDVRRLCLLEGAD
uniref:DUF5641 domain-containing protein n=1 Tax=Echinostoma caproni TaxID=27848 RepID=A0A183B704_9TREM